MPGAPCTWWVFVSRTLVPKSPRIESRTKGYGYEYTISIGYILMYSSAIMRSGFIYRPHIYDDI